MSTQDTVPSETPAAAAPDSLTALLTGQHRRLTALWDEIQDAIARGDFRRLQSRASEFIRSARAHLDAEEQVLYPALEQRLGTGRFGPTAEPRSEHARMRHALDALRKLETTNELWTAITTVEGQPVEPGALLRSHFSKEENVLYPLAERTFTDAERTDLLGRLRAAAGA
jgi:hemerythrin-like domain-containing protein